MSSFSNAVQLMISTNNSQENFLSLFLIYSYDNIIVATILLRIVTHSDFINPEYEEEKSKANNASEGNDTYLFSIKAVINTHFPFPVFFSFCSSFFTFDF